MKILIHGNGPNVSTGYGQQVRQLVTRLHDDGHKPAVSCTYGQQGGIGHWAIPGLPASPENTVRVYPLAYRYQGDDILEGHADHWFRDDPGWIITLIDTWAIQNPLSDYDVAAWCPIDHATVPPGVLQFFDRTKAVPIAMSRFGEAELRKAGLDPVYIPLTVDTKQMRPMPTFNPDGQAEITARRALGLPEDVFVVGMVAMNKGWARDRKGFNEALHAFGLFWRDHQDAVLYMHCEASGAAEGMDLRELAIYAGVPEHAIKFVDQYHYILGLSTESMAATYSAFDVLLAPSHGEGFCVPLIEAQACGTPVIASNFSAQDELVGAGWKVRGQPEWDPAQHSKYQVPYIWDVVGCLEEAFAARQDEAQWAKLQADAIEFAAQYDADRVFEEHWRPFLASLEPAAPEAPAYDRSVMDRVAVIVPAMRPENLPRLIESFEATNDGTARLVIVMDKKAQAAAGNERHDLDEIVDGALSWVLTQQDHTTYAEKVNLGFAQTTAPWVLLVGDDVEFKPGWLEEARKLSDRFDVIGTNDTSEGVKNPDVASGKHADHFFVRRAYVDAEGACLDGPGVLAPEAYRHWYTDKEMIGLAKARGVFTPCLTSIIEHHHPGYLGREDLRREDPTYMKAVDAAEDDKRTWHERLPLIEMQRAGRAKIR